MTARLLTPDDVAEILNVSPKTLAKWRWSGEGPKFVKIGRCVRYASEDLDLHIDRRRRHSTSDYVG